MKIRASIPAISLPTPKVRRLVAMVAACLLASAASGVTLWWDSNANTAGAGTTPTGTWDTTNSNKDWSSNIGGTSKTNWTDGSDAVFSAGSDATGAYTVTASTVSVSSISIEEGTPTFSGGTITFGDATPDFTVGSGVTATVNSGVAGTNGLNKLGAGTLIFGTSDKAYTGTTTISAGTLQTDFNQIGRAS